MWERPVGDTIAEIETELRRAIVTLDQANEQRKKLKDSFAKLSQDEAATLLTKIFTLDRSRLPLDFRRLHRAVRLELLNRVSMKLGTQVAENFRAAFTATGETPVKKGL